MFNREQFCSKLINLIKDKKNVTYRFLDDSPILSDLTPKEIDEITVEISFKLSESPKDEIMHKLYDNLRSPPKLQECIMHEEREIIKRPYFDQVLSIVKQHCPEVKMEDIMYIPNSKKVHPFFGTIEVTKVNTSYFKFIFKVSLGDFMNNQEKWTEIINQITGESKGGESGSKGGESGSKGGKKSDEVRKISEQEFVQRGIEQWKLEAYASNSYLVKIPAERQRLKEKELRQKYQIQNS